MHCMGCGQKLPTASLLYAVCLYLSLGFCSVGTAHCARPLFTGNAFIDNSIFTVYPITWQFNHLKKSLTSEMPCLAYAGYYW
jgi:hypothetical protein